MTSIHNIPRPKKGVTRDVWDIADKITADKRREAGRAEVIERAVIEKIDAGTANKQYYDWRKSYRKTHENDALGFSEAPVAPFHVRLQMGADGRILIPADMRRAMKIESDGQLNAELVDGELRLFSPRTALEKLQLYVQAHDRGSGSAVDELLAERRAEAGCE